MQVLAIGFRALFRKYRLRAEFAVFSELGLALAEKGLIYEDSIFSHWQKGDRVPNRQTLLTLIEIFADRQSIRTLAEANQFLASAEQGYLTEQEAKKIRLDPSEDVPFQVPNQIENFTGREVLIKRLTKEIDHGNILLVHGPAGVGKSTLAVKLGYLLKDKFSGGVLWYRLDTSDVMDILLSIAFAFGKDIGYIQDKEIRASTVRSILAKKKVLLIFDNAELKNDIGLLLPNEKNCSVIITSRYANLPILAYHKSIFLESFTIQETVLLFETILGNDYVAKNKSYILELGERVGYLPLALHIFAQELKKGSMAIAELLEEIQLDTVSLQELSYGDRNLYLAINLSLELLDYRTKKIFLSLSVFDGKDFPVEAVAHINNISVLQAKKLLNILKNVSLIEESSKARYRMHPMIKRFVRTKVDDPSLFLRAAKYYENFLGQYGKEFLKSYPNIKQESDNVVFIFKRCYELHYWDEVIALWTPLETLLYATNQLNKMRYLFQIVNAQQTGINIFQKILIVYFCSLSIFWIIFSLTVLKTSFSGYLYSFLFSLVPLVGGIIGFFISGSWGLFKSIIGRSVLFLSGGLFTWGVGGMIWAYYNFFLNNPVPYPSLADPAYIISYPLWAFGVMSLPHAIGGESKFKKKYGKIFFAIPVFVLGLSYYLLVLITKSVAIFAPFQSWLKLFFDIAYPAGDAIILTAALFIGISFKFFGGKYKLFIYSILLGFCFQYIGDFLFSYVTTVNIYYNGGVTDLIFTIGMSLVTFGVLGFYSQEG